MKIIGITDIHGDLESLTRCKTVFKDSDLVVIAGDITHFAGTNTVTFLTDHIRQYNENIFAVSGNCDYPEVETFLEQNKYGLHGKIIEKGGIQFTGIGGSLPCPGRTPNEYIEEKLIRLLSDITKNLKPDKPFILVTHQPPYDTLNDEVDPGEHVGSSTLRSFIEEHQPLVCFTGHIHEGKGIDTIGKTKIINPGPLKKGFYAYVEVKNEVLIAEIRHY